MPCEMETAYKKGNIERLMHLKDNLCMECGLLLVHLPGAPTAGPDQQAGKGAGYGL